VTLSQKCCRGTVQTAVSHITCLHRSSLKDAWNSRVFICRLNAKNCTGNARSPSVVLRVVDTSNVDVDPERSRRRDSTPDDRCGISARYDGAMP